MSYFDLTLKLQYAVPIALATSAQMFINTVNDLDLSIGPFVGLTACIGATVIAWVVHVTLMRSSYGVVLRGAGGNPKAIGRAEWSLMKTKTIMFASAGFFGVLSGFSLIGLTSAANAHTADRYTLYSIAGGDKPQR